MAGAKITLDYNSQAAEAKLQHAMSVMRRPQALLEDWGEELVASSQARFSSQTGPDGQVWDALSPRYAKRKKSHQDKALVLRGHLHDLLHYQINGNALLVGSDRKYAAIHQMGGEIEHAAHSKQVRHRTDAKGNLLRTNHFNGMGLIFAKSTHKRAVTRWFEVGAFKIKMPARPFLGVSAADEKMLLQKAEDRLLAGN